MQIVIFDRQSIFVHGMDISLKEHIPGVNIAIVDQADNLWRVLLQHPDALLILDGGMEPDFCQWLLQEKYQQFPESKNMVIVSHKVEWINETAAFNVHALVPRDTSIERFVHTIKSVMHGVVCLPNDWRQTYEDEILPDLH